MNEQWRQYLTEKGARFNADGGVEAFAEALEELRGARGDKLLCELSFLGIIEVKGADAEKFLQGQLTNDVRQVTPEHSQLSAWCTPKGRVQVGFRVLKRADAYYLLLPREQLAATLKRLQMYVLRADAQLREVTDELPLLGIAGNGAAELLAVCGMAETPSSADAGLQSGAYSVVKIAGTVPRYLLMADTEAQIQLWGQAAALGFHAAAYRAWQLLDIEAGLPQVTEATKEAFVPQMLNLQAINGLSFKKGCYTGQEVVARSQFIGTLKRRMYRVHVDGTACPAAGADIYSAGNSESAGKIVNAQPNPEGGCEALAVIRNSGIEAGNLHVGDNADAVLSLRELPYSLEAAL